MTTVKTSGYKIVMPRLGLTMTEASITRWLQNEGAWVKKGTPLFELEYEKATLEMESPASGWLRILVPVQQVVPVLTPIAVLEEADVPSAAAPVHVPREPAAPGSPAETPLGAQVIASQPEQAPLRATPKARKLARKEGIDLHALSGSGPRAMIVAQDVLEAARALSPHVPGVRISPLARLVAQEMGVNPQEISGSGPQGRIMRSDIERATQSAPAAALRPAGSPDLAALSGLRGVIASRLSASWLERPQVTLTTEADATCLVAMRKQMQEEWQVKLSYNAFLVKVAARALAEHPAMNARLTPTGIQILPGIHIGLAVETPRGLLVPVVKDADKISLREANDTILSLAKRALEGRSQPDELSGGTFTLTNLGMYEIDAFTPLINPPECAILGIGRIVARPVGLDGQIVLREMMALSLSFDHRLVDGAPAARFLQRIKTIIERCFLIGFEA